MVDVGNFLNDFATDAHALAVIGGACSACLAVFSVLYNRWMSDLGDRKQGYTALLVALGNGVTLAVVAVISWKAAGIVLVAFAISGTAMISGDISRSNKQRDQVARRPRRKALPYAAAGLIDDAIMTLAQVERGMVALLEGKSDDRKLGLLALAVKDAGIKLTEARKVEGD